MFVLRGRFFRVEVPFKYSHDDDDDDDDEDISRVVILAFSNFLVVHTYVV